MNGHQQKGDAKMKQVKKLNYLGRVITVDDKGKTKKDNAKY